jgi:hypothetical protein
MQRAHIKPSDTQQLAKASPHMQCHAQLHTETRARAVQDVLQITDQLAGGWCPCAPPGRGPCVPCEINTFFFSTAAARPARTRAQQLALADLP